MALSAFREQKANRFFSAIDANGDGFIDQADVDQGVARFGEALGLAPGSSALQRLAQAYSAVLALGATDHDGRIGLDDFKNVGPDVSENPAGIQAVRSLFDAMVQLVDGDGDGKLTKDEYARLFAIRLAVPEDHAHEAFSKLDTDGDGLVATDQIVEAVREYHFNDDPNSCGSWLLGPLEPA
jgi:Ca2+-binding EF-hand superfamily protein